MIVRLKELPENNYTKSMMFQFYDSPIKSLNRQFEKTGSRKVFQFYDSPIKSPKRMRHTVQVLRVSIL